MPEGAEVKIIGEGLAKMVHSRVLRAIIPLSGRYTKNPIPGLTDFSSSKVVGIGTKGKLIFWIFNNETFLLNTLGMTGTWSKNKTKHSRVEFVFAERDSIFYTDIRNFGTLKIIKDKRNFVKKLNSLGPDMLSEEVTNEKFSSALDKKPHWPISKAIMDQSVICGVGNYVKAESLYLSSLSPHRPVASLSSANMDALNKAIKKVLREAYAAQGASIRNYQTVEGKKGQATLQFMVYGKKNDPNGKQVIKETTADGRTTHWVPEVQK